MYIYYVQCHFRHQQTTGPVCPWKTFLAVHHGLRVIRHYRVATLPTDFLVSRRNAVRNVAINAACGADNSLSINALGVVKGVGKVVPTWLT
jgi:hypothetical protein